MTNRRNRLELTWIGKEERPRLEPRILLEDEELSYAKRVSGDDLFDNRLIHGDNLLALKALEQEFAGKVKCVFIDPPYNTGSAFEHYDDGLEHSLWLSLMRDRLEIIHKLLREDGVLFCSIDNHEVFYLGVLLDEIFGRANRLEVAVWKKSFGGGAKARFFVNVHEFVLCYARNIDLCPKFLGPPDPDAVKKYYRHRDDKYEQRGPFTTQPLATTSMDARPNLRFPITAPDGSQIWPEKQWQWSRQRVAAALSENRLLFTRSRGEWTVAYKQYLKDEDGQIRGSKPKSILDRAYTMHGTNESAALFGQEAKFSFPKPESLVSELIVCCSAPGDLVLDSFLGSGTTAAVAHKMGRRWIGIELADHAITHCVPRLKKVIAGEDPGGITEAVGWTGGGGFRFFKLAPSLLEKDKWGNWIVSRQYNPEMLAEAMCKLEGFRYAPDRKVFWNHGHSTERDFIYVTTQDLSSEQFQFISEQVGPERTLLICCGAFRGKPDFANLTVKKIPQAVLARCEWGRDDYSLNVAEQAPVVAVEASLSERLEDAAKANAPLNTGTTTKAGGRRKKPATMQDLPLFARLDNEEKRK